MYVWILPFVKKCIETFLLTTVAIPATANRLIKCTYFAQLFYLCTCESYRFHRPVVSEDSIQFLKNNQKILKDEM